MRTRFITRPWFDDEAGEWRESLRIVTDEWDEFADIHPLDDGTLVIHTWRVIATAENRSSPSEGHSTVRIKFEYAPGCTTKKMRAEADAKRRVNDKQVQKLRRAIKKQNANEVADEVKP